MSERRRGRGKGEKDRRIDRQTETHRGIENDHVQFEAN